MLWKKILIGKSIKDFSIDFLDINTHYVLLMNFSVFQLEKEC